MTMHRRDLLKAGAAFAAAAVATGLAPASALAQAVEAAPAFAPSPGAWRDFEIVTRIELAGANAASQAWVPLPAFHADDWARPGASRWNTNAGTATRRREPLYGAEMLHVEWAAGERAPQVEITSRFASRDRAVDFSKPGHAEPLSADDRALYTKGTALIPINGLVRQTARTIVASAATDIEKARAIYEWVVENTFRNAATRGCGVGDVEALLKSGNLGGKCADLNALYVGLARAAGLPARDLYGVRVAASRFGYKSLGVGSPSVTKAQHCRAEVWLRGFGWVAVDPADVRKVALEEPPGNRPIDDAKVAAARHTLFGAWEGNWLPYNTAHDVSLPGSKGPPVGFLMYPQAEMAATRLDCLDPETFRYTIEARDVTA